MNQHKDLHPNHNKRVLIFCSIAFPLMLAYVFLYAGPRNKEWTAERYRQFNHADLNGEIVNFRAAAGGIYFQLKNDPNEYHFYPQKTKSNECHSFSNSAELGSKIIKGPLSDTLRLVLKDHVCLYTFRKIEAP